MAAQLTPLPAPGSGQHRTGRWLAGLLLAALLAVLLVRATGSERGTLLHVLLGLLPLVLLPAYPLLVVARLLRSPALGAAALTAVAGHLLVVAPALGAQPVPEAARDAPRLRVVVANLFVANPDPARTGRFLRAVRPDLVVVPELTAQGLAGLRASGLLEDLPHVAAELQGRGETVGLLSALPLQDRTLRRVGTRAVVQATVAVEGVPVRVVPGHPLPPWSAWEPLWRAALQDLRADVADEPLPVLLPGDLNSDRDSAGFRSLLATGLRDAADELGEGLARTYPSGLPLLHLDHVLVRDGAGAALVPLRHEVLTLPGSDHRAVLVDVAVVPRP